MIKKQQPYKKNLFTEERFMLLIIWKDIYVKYIST